jgi:ketosteroid isomerase-like protein
MQRSLIIWSLAALAAFPSLAATVDRQAALDAMVAAEKSFAKAAAEKGTRSAFLEYLADDSLVLAPGLAPGKATWQARPVRPALLSWYPIVADVSLAGDLGYTTGPWEYRPKGKDDPNVLHGFFTTLWRRQADGSYKVEFDGGMSTPAPPASATEVKIAKASPAKVEDPPKVDEMAGHGALFAADRTFASAAAAKGAAAAYAGVLADNARFHHEGAIPVVSKKAILANLAAHPVKMSWLPIQSRISSSGDLGYTAGKEQIGDDQGYYLRIWKKQADGTWKVVLDLFSAPPQEKPAETPRKPPGHP